MTVRLLQLENAFSPMKVALSGMLTKVRLLKPLNAQPPMLVTPSCTTTEVMSERKEYQGGFLLLE